MLLDPTVQIEPTETGIGGNRPVGSTRTRLLGTIDYRPPSLPDLSVDVAIEHTGKQSANLNNTLDAPAATIVDLGTRYRFAVGHMRGTLRLRVLNLFDTYAWEVRGNGAFGYNPPRQITARVTLDF